MTQADPYIYPGSTVLRNKLAVTDAVALQRIERRLVTLRVLEGIPPGRFDLTHLQAIHRHLFQDVYEWAGEIRRVEIAKGGSQFHLRRFIETGMRDVHQRLATADFLRGLSAADFAAGAAQIVGDVNYVHPFRDGNGRTQLFYLEQLAEQAGHSIDLRRLRPRGWIAASRAAHAGAYGAMVAEIQGAIRDEG